ncbi:glycosyltransferase family 2 protein [Microbacterium esteraromaticum]|uniref:glycosyltransferase family 2 protein n=1 Tax=Microbacterium esteraromaticum TaxID=57043 RepID=UPI001C96B8DA|nr:glycosyltransferase family 2 protein [Microbacterium esteraromaticum]MBY6060311.1 glycosyltransferase [Microbacterium esteraromaticum]
MATYIELYENDSAVMRPSETTNRLVSVIVPVYNIETLVGACVRSLLQQTYRELEILLVDDGSTDESTRICEEFAASDPRVKVLRKRNGGLSDARNHGIERACGSLLTCVDGDDLVASDYIENLLRPFEDSSVDVSTIGFIRVLEGYEPPVTIRPTTVKHRVLDTTDALEKLFLQQGITTSAWGKLYRRELFDGIRYPIGSIHEDLPVTFRLFAKADAVAVVDATGYYYVQRETSITGRADFTRRLEAIEFAEQAVDLVDPDSRLGTAAKVRVLMECAYLVTQVPSVAKLRALDPIVAQTVKRYRRDAVRSSVVPQAQRTTALASYGGLPTVWVLMRARLIASVWRTRSRSK